MDRDRLVTEYEGAVLAEREAWLKVRGKHVGTRLHDPALWREWVDAAEHMRQLALQLQALGSSEGRGRPA